MLTLIICEYIFLKLLDFSRTKMSMTDNYSHKEEKADPSAIKKKSGMENEEEKREPANSSLDQLETEISKLSIKVMVEQFCMVDAYTFFFLVNYKESQAFREEDRFRYEDIAVVFGLNGK